MIIKAWSINIMLYRKKIKVKTERGVSYVELTRAIEKVIEESGVKDGICNIALKATTAGLLINEHDLLLLKDFERFFKELIKENRLYAHPDNAFSHLRASLLKNEITLPIENGKLVLGTWQSILLFEFDIRDREREIVVTIIGEGEKE